MRYMKWIGLAAAFLLVISCFIPWVYIASIDTTIIGFDAFRLKLGRPGFFHLVFTFFFLILHFIPKIWAKRINLIVAALNTAWALRNFFVVAACQGGYCPEKKPGLYLMLASSILLLISSLFPDLRVINEKKKLEIQS